MSSILVRRVLSTNPSQQDIERTIQLLKRNIQELEYHRNAYLVVSRLPVEIISLIFEHLVNACVLRSETEYTHRNPYLTWRSVTQVCRLWRTVALNSPRLWTNIFIPSSQDLRALFLERSKSVLLYLKARYISGSAVSQIIISNSVRWDTIELNFTCAEWLVVLKRLENIGLPALRKLTMRTSHRSRETPHLSTFSPPLGLGTVPPLRHLSLYGPHIDLDVPYFTHLHSLYISESRFDPHAYSAQHVIAALRHMSNLETLDLLDVFNESQGFPKDLEVCHLPYLTRLRLSVGHISTVSILDHISCPVVQSLDIDVWGQFSPKTLRHATAAFCATARFDPSSWRVSAFVFFSSAGCSTSVSLIPPNRLPTPLLCMTIKRGPSDFAHFPPLFSSLCLCDGSQFTLRYRAQFFDTRRKPEAIVDVQSFRTRLHLIERLEVFGIHYLIAILSEPSYTDHRGDEVEARDHPGLGTSISFPALKEITLTILDKQRNKKRALQQLKTMLANRRVHGATIAKLTIKQMLQEEYLTQDNVKLLKDVVGTLIHVRTEHVEDDHFPG